MWPTSHKLEQVQRALKTTRGTAPSIDEPTQCKAKCGWHWFKLEFADSHEIRDMSQYNNIIFSTFAFLSQTPWPRPELDSTITTGSLDYIFEMLSAWHSQTAREKRGVWNFTHASDASLGNRCICTQVLRSHLKQSIVCPSNIIVHRATVLNI